jgi:hypothetical protein
LRLEHTTFVVRKLRMSNCSLPTFEPRSAS